MKSVTGPHAVLRGLPEREVKPRFEGLAPLDLRPCLLSLSLGSLPTRIGQHQFPWLGADLRLADRFCRHRPLYAVT